MRIRTIKTGSGKHAIQVVSKCYGKLIIHKHVGTYETLEQRSMLLDMAAHFVADRGQQLELLATPTSATTLSDIAITTSQPLFLYELLTRAYITLGFSSYDDNIIRDLVVARIVSPTSKRETQETLNDSFGCRYSLKTIYRHLKTAISRGLKEQYQKALISFAGSKLHDNLHLVFYDVTTLAFATQTRTALKDFGYSKDHRSQDTQIVVGLVVNRDGFPLYFDAFSGNAFEGGTFIKVIKNVRKLLSTPDLVVVADAGMLSQNNMDELEREGILFVVGARISSLPLPLIAKISECLDRKDRAATETAYKQYRLLADYSDKRAKKDQRDLIKQWERAERALVKPDGITRRYRFLQGSKRTSFSLNTRLKEKAEMIAGIKGYVTNTKLDALTITARYHDLWRIEKAFRMTKEDLKARPVFLHLDETIKAHLTIVFAGLAISRYLEIKTGMSIHSIIKLAQKVLTHTLINAKTGEMAKIQTTITNPVTCGKLSLLTALKGKMGY